MIKQFDSVKRQQGSALIISLIILVLMLIIGTTGMQTTIMEERMAGNVRDYNNAFQAGESGLVDGEQDLVNKDSAGVPLRTTDYVLSNFTAGCVNGLCLISTTGTPQWMQSSAWSNAKEYGSATNLNPLPPWPTSDPDCTATPTDAGCRAQPQYLIEHLNYLGSVVTGRVGYGSAPPGTITYYRVTAQGFGIAKDSANVPLARAMVQSVYGK
jgi:type IV pilus assembly protein PilX